ncbi:hypothetical protein WH47_10228 [Habropoda laboriosa]|uniref:Histone-lysine N-methyltransferase SETMAR n=1 Tax=Habropoda laboriosa TaxID=597456 RepID=A0A0L7R4R9_9HYME|nr:hypothetical protein WH47_10228 [Habropoda laboriosa]
MLHCTWHENVREKLREFEWEIVSHPSYSSNVALQDCYLFRALQLFSAGEKLDDIEFVRNNVEKCFSLAMV